MRDQDAYGGPQRQAARRKVGTFATRGAAIAAGCVVVLTTAVGSAHAADAPEGRAYELVSPLVKSGNAVMQATGLPLPGWAAADGSAMIFNPAGGPTTENAIRGINFPQVAVRTDSGWVNRQVANGPRPDAALSVAGALMNSQLPSSDMQNLLFSSGSPYTLDNPLSADSVSSGGVNVTDGDLVHWASKPTWSGAAGLPGNVLSETFVPAGGSSDLSTVYFMSQNKLDALDGATPRGPYTWATYKWKDGVLASAGILPDGTLDPEGSVVAGIAPPNSETGRTQFYDGVAAAFSMSRSVSEDGAQMLFVSPDPASESTRAPQLYLAREGQASVQISKRADEAQAPPGRAGVARVGSGGFTGVNAQTTAAFAPGTYAISSADRSVVVFSSADQLTDDAPADATLKTYRYAAAGGGLTYLPELTRPALLVGDISTGHVLGVNDDGTRIFFQAADGDLKLWRSESSVLTIASVDSTSTPAPQTQSRFSDDGKTIVFMSREALNGEALHPPGGGPAQTQIYRYTERNQSLECISCPPASVTPQGPAAFSITALDNGLGYGPNNARLALMDTRGVTDDGETVFFTTTSPLSIDDTNTAADVYQWKDGEFTLISSGGPSTGSNGSFLVDTSANGDDVFFLTRDPLDPADNDGSYDLYDARVGGGFPDQADDDVCVGDACQGDKAAAPPLLGGASSIVGPVTLGARDVLDNAQAPPRATLRISRPRSSAKQVTLGVRVSGAGKLRASGRGLATANRTVKRVATYTVKVKLSAASRRTLSKKGRLKVRVSVRFTPAQGKAVKKAVTLTIKRPTGASRKAR